MTATSPRALALSATLHGGILALALLVGYATRDNDKPQPKILELVAGVGDNYLATEAPALGVEGGIKLTVKTPEPAPAPPAPPEPAPLTPAPPVAQPKVPTPKSTKAPDAAVPDFKKQIKQQVRTADNKAKREVAKERAVEKKRLELEQKRTTKEEFDRANRSKSPAPAPKGAVPKVAKIDVEGIRTGVAGGSTANKIGGAGGTALTVAERTATENYEALLLQRLKAELDKTPGLDDGLRAEAEFRVNSDGRLSQGRLLKSSGNREFDNAVLHAILSVRLPPRPKGFAESLIVPFNTEGKK